MMMRSSQRSLDTEIPVKQADINVNVEDPKVENGRTRLRVRMYKLRFVVGGVFKDAIKSDEETCNENLVRMVVIDRSKLDKRLIFEFVDKNTYISLI